MISSGVLLGLFVAFTGDPAPAPGPVRFNEADFDPTAEFPEPVMTGEQVDLDIPSAVVRYILSSSPEVAVVYPTERYYYFEFDQGPRRIAGNLRFTDAHDGAVHIGYFDRFDRRFMRAATFRDGEDGVRIRPGVGPHTYRVEFEGVSRTFRLDRTVLDAVEGVKLTSDERLVSPVMDESGFALVLVFHEPQAMFYYLLHPKFETPTVLEDADSGSHRFLVDRSGGFVFWRDPLGRDVLVGVRRDEIAENSYFDGPFDQVPPDLPLRPLLQRAYPYVDARGGIDEHGNFVMLTGQRVAISPYVEYGEIGRFLGRAGALLDVSPDRADRPACASLVIEPKRRLLRRLPAVATATGSNVPESFGAPHARSLSFTWPADHFRAASERRGSP
jgi:hypothetical protein